MAMYFLATMKPTVFCIQNGIHIQSTTRDPPHSRAVQVFRISQAKALNVLMRATAGRPVVSAWSCKYVLTAIKGYEHLAVFHMLERSHLWESEEKTRISWLKLETMR